MSIAWTTIVVILLLLPGVGFFIGFWAKERYSREVVKSGAIGEVGMAVFVATVIHLFAWWLLFWNQQFDLAKYLHPAFDITAKVPLSADDLIERLWSTLWYVIVTSIVGFVAGFIVAWMVMFGPLRFLATHAWAYDLIKDKKQGIVTAYVMTNIVENKRILMYTGYLEEFYLDTNGCFSYIVLKACSRYYMHLGGAHPKTSPRLPLFRVPNIDARKWEHFAISGENISNVLFDPLGDITSAAGTKSLDDALAEPKPKGRSTSRKSKQIKKKNKPIKRAKTRRRSR